jgi:protein phosphatase
VDEGIGVFMVADGMGGHLGGEFASQLAVKTVREVLTRFRDDPEAAAHMEGIHTKDHGEQLKYSIRLASRRIFRDANRVATLRGMGTTTVALLVRDQKGYIAHVGDSRAYLIRPNGIQQLTMDHSLVVEQLQAGFITEEEVKTHRLKNIITRSVGFQDHVDIDLSSRDLQEGDRFLLCSDGLTNLVPNEEILEEVLKGRDCKATCQKLVALANQRGGDDNVTVIVVAVNGKS